MPDLLTPQALATAGPLVLDTFFKHFLTPKKSRNNEAREDLMYDEAFVLMKTFLEIATKYPVAALQRFGLVRTPAPPWVALHRVLIPQSNLLQAADHMVEALGGEEMAYKIAGGSKWWQVRAGPGVEGEWIVMKKDWKEMYGSKDAHASKKDKSRMKPSGEAKSHTEAMSGEDAREEGMVGEDGGVREDGEFRKEMDELRCMLYIHGGAYYWGSINTHRYTIWRYARKMHGRCFAVNYRTPQYPFPCAIQDCLAAWMYLVDPPPEARHKPVNPKNIVLAGDSAGGGLVWALLQILRDTPGLELPAGAVLISPWSDLTHSFPSILKNTATDIVPPYGFIHKPSSLWPPPPPELTEEIQGTLRSRVREAVSRIKGDHHHHVHLHHTGDIQSSLVHDPTVAPEIRSSSPHGAIPAENPDDRNELHPISTNHDTAANPGPTGEPRHSPHRANPAIAFANLEPRTQGLDVTAVRQTTLTQCAAPLELEVKDTHVKIDTQIQLYATNAQLCHPWVSPILGYLGGLPPLLIIAGDKEVLRDEIIYIAHKAANPQDHPLRDDVRALLPSLRGIEERHCPTNVHLQVYDGACHDLPLFSMTKVARGVFRAIALFARYVTPTAPGSLPLSRSQVGTPNSSAGTPNSVPPGLDGTTASEGILGQSLSATPRSSVALAPEVDAEAVKKGLAEVSMSSRGPPEDGPSSSSSRPSTAWSTFSSKFTRFATPPAAMSREGSADGEEGHSAQRPKGPPPREGPSGDDAGPRFGEDPADRDSKAPPGSAGHPGVYRGDNPFVDNMIRERVATDGTCRPLESPEELSAMTMPEDEVGTIKEGPAIRYLNGQALWDKKYKRAIKSIERSRKKNLRVSREKDSGKIAKMWERRVKERKEERERKAHGKELSDARDAIGLSERNEGWDTEAATDTETEPDSPTSSHHRSIEEELMDQSWSWTWALEGEVPPPSAIVSRRDFNEARQLALMADRMDTSDGSNLHGLSIWVGLAAFFSNSTERSKAQDILKRAHEEKKAEKAGRGTLPGESPIGRGAVEGIEHRAKSAGRFFGFGKKHRKSSF